MVKIAVVLMSVELVVGVSWRVVMAVVRLLMATLWVVATALEGRCVVAMTVISGLLVLPLTLVVVGWLLENNFRR